MEASSASAPPGALESRRRASDRFGDSAFRVVTGLTALGAVALIGLIIYKVVDGAWPSISQFGIPFIWHETWDAVANHFGALDFTFGTIYTTGFAILFAAPVAIAIGLYLSELAPTAVRGIIGSLVEMLAAIPSVVLGLWGILVLGPFVERRLEPDIQHGLGFLPIFGGRPSASGMLTAGLVLAIMVVPIVASISRELFASVPRELEEGALALGVTRWEMVRGVVLSSARPGIAAALILGLGRALGEAIAVTQVIGGAAAIHASLFAPADTLASRIANQFQGATTRLQVSSLFYLAAILLVIGLIANLLAQAIVRRFEYERRGI